MLARDREVAPHIAGRELVDSGADVPDLRARMRLGPAYGLDEKLPARIRRALCVLIEGDPKAAVLGGHDGPGREIVEVDRRVARARHTRREQQHQSSSRHPGGHADLAPERFPSSHDYLLIAAASLGTTAGRRIGRSPSPYRP